MEHQNGYTDEEMDRHLIALVNAANENANQRISDKGAIGASDCRRIEAYRTGQILAGCRKYPGVIADVIWGVMPPNWNGQTISRKMSDDEIDRFDYNAFDQEGRFIGNDEERLTARILDDTPDISKLETAFLRASEALARARLAAEVKP